MQIDFTFTTGTDHAIINRRSKRFEIVDGRGAEFGTGMAAVRRGAVTLLDPAALM
jgi:hypothetical protein